MTKADIPNGLIGLVCLLLAAGCGTIEFPRRAAEPDPTSSAQYREASRQADALTEYSLGVIAQKAGDTEAAVEHFRAAVKKDPENTEIKLELAVGLMHLAKYTELDALLDEVAQNDPDSIRVYQLKVLSLRLRGMNEEALVPLEKATELNPGEPVHYIERASIHLRLKQPGEAVSVLEGALDSVTNRLAVYNALGEVYLRMAGDSIVDDRDVPLPEKPLDVLRHGLEEFPDDLDLMNQYGDLLILHQRIEEAIDVFTQIEERHPGDPQLRQKLALSLISIGDRERAVEMLEDIAAKRKDNAAIWLYLAELHEGGGNIERALECLDQVIASNPQLPDGYIQKAYVLLSNARTEEARELLIQASRELRNNPQITEMLAYVYMANDDYADAITLFKRVEQETADGRGPLLSNFYQNYAVANQMIGATESAAQVLRKGHTGNPDIVLSYLQLALRNRRAPGRLESTLDVMDLIPAITPETGSVSMLHALVAFNAEQHQKALELFEKTEQLALEAEDEELLTAQFYFWMGASAERLKQFDKAEEYFLDAINLQPDYAEAHNYLAYMLAERGVKLEMALDHVGVALAVEPENAAYLDTRGWIYYQQGRYEEALIDIEEAIQIISDDPTIAEHLGDVYKALGNDKKAASWWMKSLAEDGSNEAVRAKLEAYEAERAADAEEAAPAPVTPAE